MRRGNNLNIELKPLFIFHHCYAIVILKDKWNKTMSIFNQLNENVLTQMVDIFSSIVEDFDEYMERKPTLEEVLSILLCALQTTSEDILGDISASNLLELNPILDDSKKVTAQVRRRRHSTSILNKLGDGVFSSAADFIVEMKQCVHEQTGDLPTLEEFCQILMVILKKYDATLVTNVTHIEGKARKIAKITPKPGDIVSIPAGGDNQFYLAVLLQKNRFGTAFGFFKGKYAVIPNFQKSPPPIHKYPIYSDTALVKNGKWQIIGHDERLLLLFPDSPEIFHEKIYHMDDPDIGPFGSGETATEQLRHLTFEEATEIGLLNEEYSSCYLGEDLEPVLEKLLL
jgi:hypothetical protein